MADMPISVESYDLLHYLLQSWFDTIKSLEGY